MHQEILVDLLRYFKRLLRVESTMQLTFVFRPRAAGLAYETKSVFFPIERRVMLRFAQSINDVRMLKRKQIDGYSPLNELVGTRATEEIFCNSAKTPGAILRKLGLETTIEVRR